MIATGLQNSERKIFNVVTYTTKPREEDREIKASLGMQRLKLIPKYLFLQGNPKIREQCKNILSNIRKKKQKVHRIQE